MKHVFCVWWRGKQNLPCTYKFDDAVEHNLVCFIVSIFVSLLQVH